MNLFETDLTFVLPLGKHVRILRSEIWESWVAINDFNEVIIVANDPIKHLSSEKIVTIEDYKKDLGPLGGIFSAMKWVKNNNKKYQWIITFPSDTPFFKNKIMNSFLNKINIKESELFFMKSNELWFSTDFVELSEKDR